MAPRKEKREKASTDNAADAILHYLRKQNRPYSAADISANLHGKPSKAVATKILKELHERKDIEGRAAGKQVVYHAIQNPTSNLNPEALAQITSETTRLTTETASLRASEKALKSSLAALTATPSTADLQAAVAALESERSALLARLEPLRAGTTVPVSRAEKEAVEREVRLWTKVEEKRRVIREQLWGFVRDLLPEGTDVGEVMESLGLND